MRLEMRFRDHPSPIAARIVVNSPCLLAHHRLAFDLFTAPQLALLTHPTPFVNGSPFTLFHGESSYAAGAVGLAISRSSKESSDAAANGGDVGVDWGRLKPLGGEVTVER